MCVTSYSEFKNIHVAKSRPVTSMVNKETVQIAQTRPRVILDSHLAVLSAI